MAEDRSAAVALARMAALAAACGAASAAVLAWLWLFAIDAYARTFLDAAFLQYLCSAAEDDVASIVQFLELRF